MNIVYGSELSKELRNALKEEINKIEGRKPCLAVVLVGENPASVSYVRGKNKALNEVGMECRQIDLKEYPQRFMLSGLPVVNVGINFDVERHNITDWEVRDAGTAVQ